jgi:transcription elongation factor Elf1
MKAYNKCPDCDTINEPMWIMDKPNRPYYICLCTECQNMYYQLSETQDNVKLIDMYPDLVDAVPYITKTDMKSDEKEHEIKEKQTEL